MNSFTPRAIGNLSRDPEFVGRGDLTYAHFCLVGNDGGDRPSRESATHIWFTAYGPVGEEIVTKARKGDQLFVEAVVLTMMGSASAYDHTCIVTRFRFGARKASPGSSTTQAGSRPPVSPRRSVEEAAVASV
jgi:single-stranded DNA-binding protein